MDDQTDSTASATDDQKSPDDQDQTSSKPTDQSTSDDGQSDRQSVPKEVEAALRKANKEAERLRLKLKQFEDRDKTELQKLTEQRQAAESAATTANLNYLRLKVGTAKGLRPEIAERLQGADEKELSEDAERLMAVLTPNRPSGSADQGTRGKPVDKTDMESLLRAAAKG